MTVKKKIIIEGEKIHDVGYRPFLMEKAQELGILDFHPKNLKRNGKEILEVLVGGEDEDINCFLEFIKENYPEKAEVGKISLEDYEGNIMTMDEFLRLFSASQLSKIVQTGLGMIGKQDTMIEKQDIMIGKQDQTIDAIHKLDNNMTEQFDRRDTKYDKISQNLEKILKEMK